MIEAIVIAGILATTIALIARCFEPFDKDDGSTSEKKKTLKIIS